MTQVHTISSECLEILAFLLNKINKNHGQSVKQPLYKWSDLLRSNGFYPEELGNFFVSADALDHWHGPLGLDALYRQSILESYTTGEFLDAIYTAEPDYIEFISNKVDCLLAERNQLLAAAGGTLKHPAGDGAAIGISSGVLFLSCFILYKKRGSWLPSLSRWADVASGWFTNREVATVNDDLDSAITFEIKTISNPYKDIFKYAIEPVLSNAPISDQQLRRDRLRFDEDPTSFLDDMVKSHPGIFDLTPAGFKADLKYQYAKEIAEIQVEFNNHVDKVAKAYYADWFKSNNPQHSVGKVIQQEEIKVAKQTLLNAAKANSDGENISTVFQWFQAKDERQRLVLQLDVDQKLFEKVNDGTGNSARLVQDLINQFGGEYEFNVWLRATGGAILESQDKLKELDRLILALDYSPEVRLLIAKSPDVDPPEIIRAAQEQYNQLEAAYKVFLSCMDLDHAINATKNNFISKVTHLDANSFVEWKYNAIGQINDLYGSDIANFVKNQYSAASLETVLEGDINVQLDDYLYKQIYGMLNLKPGQNIDVDLANYLKNQAIDIVAELDADVKGQIVDYYDAIIDDLS